MGANVVVTYSQEATSFALSVTILQIRVIDRRSFWAVVTEVLALDPLDFDDLDIICLTWP